MMTLEKFEEAYEVFKVTIPEIFKKNGKNYCGPDIDNMVWLVNIFEN